MRTLWCLAGLLLVLGAEAPAEDGQDLINEIARVWQARQDRCQSGIIKWTRDAFYEKESFDLQERLGSIVVNYEFAFKADGLCTYFEDGLRWNSDKRRFDHETLQTAIYHGDVKMLFAGQRHGRFPAGFICARPTMEWGENYNIEVPLLLFRPFAAGISWFNLNEWKVKGTSEEINGRPCLRLEKEHEHLWLDREREYLPVRHDWFYAPGQLSSRMDTDYVPHNISGWAPQTWRYLETGYEDISGKWHEQVTEGFTATVTEIQLNVPVPDSKFDITFPPGTRIRNEKTGDVAIVREDGSIRPVELAERRSGDKSWDELMHSDPPSVVNRRRWIRFWSLLAIGTASLVGFVLYRRHRSA